MKPLLIAAWLACSMLAVPLAAQSPAQIPAQDIFAESFRRGVTRVTEQSFQVKLDPQNSHYRERIKDLRGNDRYEFIVVPQGPEGDSKITSWQVRLADLHHGIYDNILRAAQEPSSEPNNNLWWLNPDGYAPVPIRAQRIIKVDSFYVILQVKNYHFTPLDSPYLDSMTVDVKFSNSDPRIQEGTSNRSQ
jgi:hypothetical protein